MTTVYDQNRIHVRQTKKARVAKTLANRTQPKKALPNKTSNKRSKGAQRGAIVACDGVGAERGRGAC